MEENKEDVLTPPADTSQTGDNSTGDDTTKDNQAAADTTAGDDTDAGQEDNETPPAPSRQERHHQRQVERLSDRLRTDASRNNDYRQQMFRSDPYKPIDYNQELEFNDPAVAQKLEQDRQKLGDYRHNQGVSTGYEIAQQERFVDRLEMDSERVANKYSVMDEDSDEFDPDITETINKLYLQTVGWDGSRAQNPNVRYRDFVEEYWKAVDRAAEARNADSAKNLARQASRTGVRPTGSSRKGLGELQPGDISKMSDEEYAKHKDAIQARIMQSLGNS